MKPLRFSFLPFLALATLLSSCGTTPVLQEIPPSTADAIEATKSLPPTPTNNFNYVFLPTNTPRATRTPSTGDLIRDATETAYQITRGARQTEVAEFPVDETIYAPDYGSGLISPDGNWLAFGAGESGVAHRSGVPVWRISRADMFSDIAGYPNIDAWSIPLFWTPDSQYIYFSETICCVDGFFLANYLGELYRLSVRTGEWAEVVQGGRHYYSFAPTGRRLVYTRSAAPVVLNVLDLQTGDLRSISFEPYEQAARVIWSPDGLRFAITAITGNDYQGNTRYWIYIFNLEAETSYAIISDSDHPSYPQGWTEEGILSIYVTNGDSTDEFQDNRYLYYNTETDQFIATPTPVP